MDLLGHFKFTWVKDNVRAKKLSGLNFWVCKGKIFTFLGLEIFELHHQVGDISESTNIWWILVGCKTCFSCFYFQKFVFGFQVGSKFGYKFGIFEKNLKGIFSKDFGWLCVSLGNQRHKKIGFIWLGLVCKRHFFAIWASKGGVRLMWARICYVFNEPWYQKMGQNLGVRLVHEIVLQHETVRYSVCFGRFVFWSSNRLELHGAIFSWANTGRPRRTAPPEHHKHRITGNWTSFSGDLRWVAWFGSFWKSLRAKSNHL